MNITPEMMDRAALLSAFYTKLMEEEDADRYVSFKYMLQDNYEAWMKLKESYEYILILKTALEFWKSSAAIAQKTASYFTRDLSWED